MTIEEMKKMERDLISPFRKKINQIFFPIYFGVIAVFTAVIILLMSLDEVKYLPVFIAWIVFFVLWALSLFFILPWINRTERDIEIERYSWLFNPPAPLESESVVIPVAEDEITYTLTAEGFRAEWEQQGEQVFDDIRENLHFIPWKEAEFTLASRTISRRVQFALAVLFEVEGEKNADGEQAYGGYLLPIDEEVYKAVHAFGLEEKMPIEWRYILYNPKDAFMQILMKGMIDDFYDVDTGKVIAEGEENF